MITVVIGGGADERAVFEDIHTKLGGPITLSALEEDSFVKFCKMALQSTQKLKIKIGSSDSYIEKIANDDIIVYFPMHYILMSKTPLIYKLSTVIEVAIDLGLEVQAFSFASQSNWNPKGHEWPPHWPSVLYHNIEKK